MSSDQYLVLYINVWVKATAGADELFSHVLLLEGNDDNGIRLAAPQADVAGFGKNQLWRIVAHDDGTYNLKSKDGHVLTFNQQQNSITAEKDATPARLLIETDHATHEMFVSLAGDTPKPLNFSYLIILQSMSLIHYYHVDPSL